MSALPHVVFAPVGGRSSSQTLWLCITVENVEWSCFKAARDSEDGEREDEEAKETWKLEVHARFVRAVQELDYMGFIRHTGRKADHVHKMVYDVAEYVE